jgi:hypothetical protein
MPDFKRFVLRIPDDIHVQLTEWARADDRSLHGLIMWIIKRALRERP